MALFVRQDENRSQLQQRLATEIQDRARAKAKQVDQPDGVEDSQYIKGTKQTTSLAWVWLALAILALVSIIYFVITTSF